MPWTRDQMAARAAQELQDGFYVNLGIGIPTLVANHIPTGMSIQLQSENGMLGMGPFPFEGEEDPDLINAGKQTVTELPTTSFFDSAASFAMVRGGHIDILLMEHTAGGKPKLLKRCTLPLTGAGVVDLIITDLGVFQVSAKGHDDGLTLIDIAPGITLADLHEKTEAPFTVAPHLNVAA
jgi:3-oxoacid CoA-transferase subunit B